MDISRRLDTSMEKKQSVTRGGRTEQEQGLEMWDGESTTFSSPKSLKTNSKMPLS